MSTALADTDLLSQQEARDLAARAAAAQQQFAGFDAEAVDRICCAIALAGDRGAETLADLAYRETRFGVYEHKVFKNRYCGTGLWEQIRPVRTIGPIDYNATTGIMTLAEPMGVIAALVPMTHPTATVIFNALIALKGRNAIVFAPHPRTARSSLAAARLVTAAAAAAGAPKDLISCMTQVSLAGTTELMHQKPVRLILATGGAAMVKAVYSSGKPTIAAGPGNVPTYVDRSAGRDLPGLVADIIASKCFDNGTPCASEQAIIADAPVAGDLAAELVRQGCHLMNERERAGLARRLLSPEGTMNPEVVGQGAARLAELGGFSVPAGTRVLLAPCTEVGRAEPFSAEILACCAAFYVVDGWQQGLERCNEILRYGGLGHTCGVWAEEQAVLTAFALKALAFRVIVNGPTNFGVLGATTNLPATLMFGGGTWGGGITSDNLGPEHLINRRRVAWTLREVPPGLR